MFSDTGTLWAWSSQCIGLYEYITRSCGGGCRLTVIYLDLIFFFFFLYNNVMHPFILEKSTLIVTLSMCHLEENFMGWIKYKLLHDSIWCLFSWLKLPWHKIFIAESNGLLSWHNNWMHILDVKCQILSRNDWSSICLELHVSFLRREYIRVNLLYFLTDHPFRY